MTNSVTDSTIQLRRLQRDDGRPLFRLHPRIVIVGENGRRDVPVLQQPFEEEPLDRSVANLARVTQRARLENQREKRGWRRLRLAQRDDGEPFRWKRDERPDHRGVPGR
jgi:hypothetical protein